MLPATRLELTIETIGALAAAPIVGAFLWRQGTLNFPDGGLNTPDDLYTPRDLEEPARDLYVWYEDALVRVVDYAPNLLGVETPHWYALLAILSAGASSVQFRELRERELIPKAPKIVQYALGAAFVAFAAYTLFGLAGLVLHYFRLSVGLRTWLSPHGDDEDAAAIAASGMHAFYFLFVFAVATAVFYAWNGLVAKLGP